MGLAAVRRDCLIWPDGSLAEHRRDLEGFLSHVVRSLAFIDTEVTADLPDTSQGDHGRQGAAWLLNAAVHDQGVELVSELSGFTVIAARRHPPGGGMRGTMPIAVLVAQDEHGALLGFLEVGLRSYADGCDPARPAELTERLVRAGGFRNTGIGAELMHAAEEWSREQGYRDMASDNWIDDHESQRAGANCATAADNRGSA